MGYEQIIYGSAINFEVLPQNKSLMSAVYFVHMLISFHYLDYTEKDNVREYRKYQCTLEGKELKYRSVFSHFYHCHRNVYTQVKKIVDEHIAVSKDTVLCQCGGHYKRSGRREHELTGIHRKWQATNNRYSPFTTPKQTSSTLT